MPALTPNTPVLTKRVFAFSTYGDMDFIALIKGALLSIAYADQWELRGTFTQEESAEEIKRVILSMSEHVNLVGSIVPIATQDIPEGMLLCDGATHTASDYPELYATIITSLKSGSTFITPDLRARFILGAQSGLYLPTDTGGEDVHTLTELEMPSHSHSNFPHSHSESGAVAVVGEISAGVPFAYATAVPTLTGATSITINATGGGQAHNNMPPFYVLRYAIIAKQLLN